MRTFLTIVTFALAVRTPLWTQETQPLAAPPDLVLQLELEGNEHDFHIGELIPIRWSYSATTPGRYLLVGQFQKLSGGHGLEISCSPEVEKMERRAFDPAAERFNRMLSSKCSGVGIGSGIGGGCGDCDGEFPLAESKIGFGLVPLNNFVRFRAPGTYTCHASSAEVTATPRGEKFRRALLAQSNPIVLHLTDDPDWSHAAALGYENLYQTICEGKTAQQLPYRCWDISRGITYLDTVESLTFEVAKYNGKTQSWENGFREAIWQTSHSSEALRLMTARFQAPDFQVDDWVLKSLARWDLNHNTPGAFGASASPALYHDQAVDTLRNYVRLLGKSLATKNSDTLTESVKTYRNLAEQQFDCGNEPLIPPDEERQALSAAGIQP